MRMDRKRYPADWREISRRIRFERAGGRCEWCGATAGEINARGSRVVLTTAHLGVRKPDGSPGNKHDKSDCRDENLACLCMACHLNFDRADHLTVQARNRRRRQSSRYAWCQLELPIEA